MTASAEPVASPTTVTLAAYLGALWPAMPAALLGREARSRIAAIAEQLPPFHVAGFEARLDDPAPVADFAACISPFDGWKRAGGEGWAAGMGAVSRLLAAAATPTSLLAGALDPVWLEFDVRRGVADPAIFFRVPPDASLVAVTDEVLEVAAGAGLREALRDRLARYDEPPLRSAVFTIGAMLSRRTEALRLGLQGVVAAKAGGLLRDLGWPGNAASIDQTVATLLPHADGVNLALDLGPGGVGRRVGLEFGFAGSRAHVPAERWHALLDQLVDTGLCLPARRDALAAWIGVTRESDDPAGWPANLVGLELMLGPYDPCLRRGVHHVKTVHDGDAPVHAKAYFGYMVGWHTE